MLCRLSLHRLGVRSDMFLPQARPADPLHTTFQCPKRQALLSMFVNWLPLMMLLHRPSVVKTCASASPAGT